MRSTQRSPGSFTCESAEISFVSAMSHLHLLGAHDITKRASAGGAPAPRRPAARTTGYASKPYSLAAVSLTILDLTSSGTPLKSRAITSRECGQVARVCG